ncbi:MAG TPA: hypothetical protein VGN17_13080 [Bryobacteraceae bacterium]|jgi:hypothetical protein
MALYRYSEFLTLAAEHAEFDKLYKPGEVTAWSGVYKCEGCGREVVHTINKSLPPQDHHQHTASQGTIRWRLIVTDAADPA